MLVRAAITLGTGPHSSYDTQWKRIRGIPFILKSHNNTDTRNQNAYILNQKYRLIMAALRSRCGHYIFALWFLSFYLFLFLA